MRDTALGYSRYINYLQFLNTESYKQKYKNYKHYKKFAFMQGRQAGWNQAIQLPRKRLTNAMHLKIVHYMAKIKSIHIFC